MAYGYLALFVLASTLIWCGFIALYDWLFGWTQWVPGVNLVYLPHGLRMILVILFAESGAVGICLGTALMGFDLLRANPALGLSHSFVAGASVWLAARLLIKRSDLAGETPQTGSDLAAIDGRNLIALAFASSALNASGHVLAWLLFESEAKQLEVRFATMFTGDLLGAVILLYALMDLIIVIEKNHRPRP